MIVEGQVHGGLAQGIGQALFETASTTRSGQLLTGSFMDYAMPRADDLPSFKVATRPARRAPHNPLGVKGCGEAGAIGSPPAVINAIIDALGVPSRCRRRRRRSGARSRSEGWPGPRNSRADRGFASEERERRTAAHRPLPSHATVYGRVRGRRRRLKSGMKVQLPFLDGKRTANQALADCDGTLMATAMVPPPATLSPSTRDMRGEQRVEQTFGLAKSILGEDDRFGFAHRIGDEALLVQPIQRVPVEAFQHFQAR